MTLDQATTIDLARRRIGDFDLCACLGREGLGTLYRAWQPGVGRLVTVKCVDLEGDDQASARFAREIRSLGRVRHSHVARILTSGREDTCLYYAMEPVEGPTLGDVWRELRQRVHGPSEINAAIWRECLAAAREARRKLEVPVGQDAEPPDHMTPDRFQPLGLLHDDYCLHMVVLMRQIAEGLGAVHAAGIVHRDVKPDNITLMAGGQQALLKDLGVVQAGGEAREQMSCFEQRVTAYREFVGTLRYASPEQALGMGQVLPQSDLYSLGASMWEMFAVRPLFDADEAGASSRLKNAVLDQTPQALSALSRSIPRTVSDAVDTCLQKDPDDRYADADQLEAALDEILPHDAREVPRVPPRRRWLGGALATAATIALVALLHPDFPPSSNHDPTSRAFGVGSPDEHGTVASSEEGTTSTRPITTVERQPFDFREKKGDVRIYALSIGVSDYEVGNLQLQYADDDASKLSEAISRVGERVGEDPRRHWIKPLRNAEAKKSKVREAVRRVVNRAGPADLIFVTFSCHGAQRETFEGIREFYFLPHDYDNTLDGRVISWDYTRRSLEQAARKGATVILIADACHSGAATDDSTGLRGQDLLDDLSLEDRIREASGLYVFAACRRMEKAAEGNGHQNGFLSLAFYEALTGEREGGSDISLPAADASCEYVTLREIWEYVERRVEELSHGKQSPTYNVYRRENDLEQVVLPRLRPEPSPANEP